MAVIAGLLAILGLLMLVVALLGFALPALFKNKKTGEIPKRSQMLIGGFVAAMISFAISAVLMPGQKSEVVSNSVAPAAAAAAATDSSGYTAEPKPQKSLGMKPEEFRRSFNSIVGQIDTDWKLAEFDIEKGEVNDTFKRMLSKNIGVIGAINKADGSLREIMVIASGSADPAENLKAIAVILAVSQSINAVTPKEENSKVVSDMVQTALKNIKTGKPVENTVGNLKYTASASEFSGLMFVVSQP